MESDLLDFPQSQHHRMCKPFHHEEHLSTSQIPEASHGDVFPFANKISHLHEASIMLT